MQDTWSVVAVVLIAVLVGAAVPVLLQLFLALGAIRGSLRRLQPKLEGTLDELRHSARRLNRATTGLEDSAQRAQNLLIAAGDVGETLRGVKRSMRTAAAVGGAVGPALAAAIRAFAERSEADSTGNDPVAPDPSATGQDQEQPPGVGMEEAVDEG